MSTPEKQDPLILRCLKAAAGIDWKALALVLAALGGLGGAIWNRVDSWVDKAIAARTQQGVYETLAQRLEEISTRLEALETAHAIKVQGVPTRTPIRGEHTKAVSAEPRALLEAIEQRTEMKFKAARLPAFHIVQQRAALDPEPVLQVAPSAE